MTLLLILFGGAVAGGGLLVVVWQVLQPPVSGAAALAQFDARLARGRRQASLTTDRRHQVESQRLRNFGSDLANALESRGVTLPSSLSASLGLVGQSREIFLAHTVLAALGGFFAPIVVMIPLSIGGTVSTAVPLWASLIGVPIGTLMPYLSVTRQAEERRRGFRHVVSAFLDLVAMNLAGGRGVPEALQAAANISDGWAMVRIRDALGAARLQGVTPWTALGELGDEVDVDELRDLSSALALVAEDGAKVRESLTARANSMRRKELAAAEGAAAARSQSMLVAQLLLCVGFLCFLIYPAIARILA